MIQTAETVRCRCGEWKVFDTTAFGRLVEYCPCCDRGERRPPRPEPKFELVVFAEEDDEEQAPTPRREPTRHLGLGRYQVAASAVDRICEGCGNTFLGTTARWCETCRVPHMLAMFRARHRFGEKPCIYCGKLYEPNGPRAKICGADACREEQVAAARAAKRVTAEKRKRGAA